MELADLADQRADRDRVLDEAAHVGVVAAAGAGGALELGRDGLREEDAGDDLAQRRVVDLAGQVLEEAGELVAVAVGRGQEVARVELAAVELLDVVDLGDQLAAEALGAARDADRVALVEAGREAVDVAERAARDRAGAVAQLEREVGRPVAGGQPVLARARVVALETLAGRELGDRVGRPRSLLDVGLGGHPSILPGEPDGARGPRGRLAPMDALQWEAEPPQLRSPVLVCAFAGWNDAAGSATAALTTAADSLDAELIAQIDPEEFFDFQANRPTISLSEGMSREIEWPGNALLAAKADGAERDLILLAGTEPNLKWKTFSEGIAGRRREARRRDGRHPRRPGRRRGAHASRPDHGARLGPRAGRAARPRALQLRGADRRRRRPARRLQPPRDAVGEPLGRGAPLRRGRPQPQGGARAAAPPRGPGRRRGRGIGARGGVRVLRGPGLERGLGQPRDPGPRAAARVRAGRPARGRGGHPLGRVARRGLRALPAPARLRGRGPS